MPETKDRTPLEKALNKKSLSTKKRGTGKGILMDAAGRHRCRLRSPTLPPEGSELARLVKRTAWKKQ